MGVENLECKRCGNTWRPRTDALPKFCPKCKAPGWKTGSSRAVSDFELQKLSQRIETLENIVAELVAKQPET